MVEETEIKIIDEVTVTEKDGKLVTNKEVDENTLLRIRARYTGGPMPLTVYILNTGIANTMISPDDSRKHQQPMYLGCGEMLASWELEKKEE